MLHVSQKKIIKGKTSSKPPPGLYSSRAALIWISVSAAIWSFCVTSSAVRFVFPSTVMRLSSSTREPCVLVSLKSKLSSSSFILRLLAVTSSSRSVRSFSSSWQIQKHHTVIPHHTNIFIIWQIIGIHIFFVINDLIACFVVVTCSVHLIHKHTKNI